MQHGPAGIAATPTEPKHLGTRLHRWNHAKPAPSHDPPSDYPVATITNARHHKGVATAELLLTNRGRLPTSAASAHFFLFSMASERRSKERRHAMEALTRRCQGYHCRVPSLNQSEMQAVSANYGSDTTLVNSTCGVASIGDQLTCSSTTAILLMDRVIALDTTGK